MRVTGYSRTVATSAVVFALALMRAAAQAAPGGHADSAGFVVRLGVDTLVVERFILAPGHLTGEVVSRAPRVQRSRYTLTWADSGPTRVELTRYKSAEPTAVFFHGTMVLSGDSARYDVTRDTMHAAKAYAVPRGTLPFINPAYGVEDLLLQNAMQRHADTLALALAPLSGAAALPVGFRRVGRDSVLLTVDGDVSRVRVDARGRLLGLAAPSTTVKIQVERVPWPDLDKLAADFAAREVAGGPLGQLSPPDSVRATIGSAHIAIDYSRPGRRGRQVFGGIVPWNEVWRTGANAATSFRTDRDLVFGGVTVPAGAYTLWSLPSPAGWKLIFNRQTGQWGTEYHADRDLARAEMQVSTVTPLEERFTIGVALQGSGGLLTLRWETTQAAITFAVK